MGEDYLRQVGTGIASLTFGVALAIFIYAAPLLTSLPPTLLYLSSFLLMIRFWWRYTELFVQHLPSRTFWHFTLDFAISFFGILTVLFVSSLQSWSLLGITAMLTSMARSGLSWREASANHLRAPLTKTLLGALLMAALFSAVYLLAPLSDPLQLSAAVLILVILFVAFSSVRR